MLFPGSLCPEPHLPLSTPETFGLNPQLGPGSGRRPLVPECVDGLPVGCIECGPGPKRVRRPGKSRPLALGAAAPWRTEAAPSRGGRNGPSWLSEYPLRRGCRRRRLEGKAEGAGARAEATAPAGRPRRAATAGSSTPARPARRWPPRTSRSAGCGSSRERPLPERGASTSSPRRRRGRLRGGAAPADRGTGRPRRVGHGAKARARRRARRGAGSSRTRDSPGARSASTSSPSRTSRSRSTGSGARSMRCEAGQAVTASGFRLPPKCSSYQRR